MPIIEVSSRSLFIRLAGIEAWFEQASALLNRHPEGHRWGFRRTAGELRLYLGPVAGVVCRHR